MSTASLCQLCQNILLNDLPPFPDASYTRTLSGYKNLARLVHLKKNDPVPEALGIHHHRDLESLRTSAAGCELCLEIKIQAEALLADIAAQEAKWAEFKDVRTPEGDPSFDLRITGRGEGGDGFWVVARSVSKPEKVLFVVATFGFCADEDTLMAKTLPGRPIIGPPSHDTMDRVALWVDECKKHENRSGHDAVLPTRVLDVAGPGPENIVTIVEPEQGATAAYTALSYCWGSVSNPYATTRSLLEDRKQGIKVSELPRTFRDGIEVTRRLGVRYMWIDSLCICQDDAKDWERESARMAAVYSNAYVVIAATGSADTFGGLFFDRPERRYLRVALRVDTADATARDKLVFPLDKDKEVIRAHRTDMGDQPLGTRAWAFQERLLARCVLHFASDQICLEGSVGTIFEDGLRMPYRYLFAHRSGEKKPTHGLGPKGRPGHDKEAPLEQWYSHLAMYSDLKLTFPEDKFPALSGLAKVFANLLDDEYVAGLWRKSLIEGLCWQSLRCRAIEKYRAPSWSWASVDGKAMTGINGRHKEVGCVVGYHVKMDGDNPFGKVKDAWLKVEAPLVPLVLSETTGPTGHIKMKMAGGGTEGAICGFDTLDRNLAVSGEAVGNMRLYALVLAAHLGDGVLAAGGEAAGEIQSYMCLLVRESGREDVVPGAMERIGWIIFGQEDLGAGELEGTTTVTLV